MLGLLVKCILATGLLAASFVVANEENTQYDPLAPIPGFKFNRMVGHRPDTKSRLQRTHRYNRLEPSRHEKSGARTAAAILGAHQRQVGGEGYQNITATTVQGTQYGIKVSFRGFEMTLTLDTGSSDTWAIPEGFECVNWSGDIMDSSYCAFGPTYPLGFEYGEIPDEHFYIQYGDGEVAEGPLGYVDVSLGDITVKNQTVALPNSTYWYGDNVTSGIIGLAYPALTNAYLGDESEHSSIYQVPYMPIFTSMVQQGLISGSFSIAISRNSSGGTIGWGGIPYDITGLDYMYASYCDIIITNLIDNPYTAYDYSFYTIVPDGLIFGSSTDSKKYPYIVDSGTTLIYVPPTLAEQINGAFSPPAVYSWMYGAYFTACDAIAPAFAVVLGGTPFYLNPVDMIYRGVRDPITGLCMTAIASGGMGPYILGDAFMQNVLTTFDIDNAQIGFVSRRFY